MKYLPKETCEYLVSLGCMSESVMYWCGKVKETEPFIAPKQNAELYGYFDDPSFSAIPAFSLEDILRKDNAEKIWGNELRRQRFFVEAVAEKVFSYPYTWPEEVAKLIKPND